MEYKRIEGIDKNISRLVYGTASCVGAGDVPAAMEVLDIAWENGFRIFDTAHRYGKAEETFGKWIVKSGHRDELVILDKGCNPCEKGSDEIFCAQTIREQVKMSLDRLQTDHVELYILHRDDPSKPVDEIVEVLNEMKDKGFIKKFGGSNWKQYRLEEANQYAEKHGLTGFTACSPSYSLARLVNDPWGGSVTISGDDNADFREWLQKTQLPVFNYSGLARGFMSGKFHSDGRKPIEECIGAGSIAEYHYPENVERLKRAEIMAEQKGCTVPQIALAWLLNQKLNLFPIVTPTGEKHVKEVVDSLKIVLNEQEMNWLYRG